MINALSVLVVLLLAIFFFFLMVRAWRARRAWIRWPGVVLSGLLGLVFLTVAGVAAYGFYQLNTAPYTYTTADVQVAMTEENIARGQRFAYVCIDCHSSTGELPLDGSGFDFFADPSAPPVGSLWGPNLTPGGDLKNWTDGEILRAVREGVDKDGRPLMIMASQVMHNMSDEDAQALVAYLRSQPAVERSIPDRNLNILAALFVGAGMFPTSAQEPITAPVVAPQAGTVEYGEYLISATGCVDCHGEKLDGVVSNAFGGGAPDLTASIPTWQEEEFIRFFREGVLPVGRSVDPMAMPWKIYGQAFTDDNLKDIYSYLHSLP